MVLWGLFKSGGGNIYDEFSSGIHAQSQQDNHICRARSWSETPADQQQHGAIHLHSCENQKQAYVSSLGDVLPVLIPAVVIYIIICGICFLLMKHNEKQINKALEEK